MKGAANLGWSLINISYNTLTMNWQNVSFSDKERDRYKRHFSLPQVGVEGQKKLKAAKVLVVGAGGLGAPLMQYLAAAGVGTIGIIDSDVVEASNLHRQILFNDSDIGRSKVAATKERLEQSNPHIDIIGHEEKLDTSNALDLLDKYDVIADGSDNFPTRFLVNDACVLLDKPLVHGSLFQFEGQVSVFNYENKNGVRGPNYRDLFPKLPSAGQSPNCAETGILGMLPGTIGCMQAIEVTKIITGIEQPLSGHLFIFDALSFNTRKIHIGKNKRNPLTGENPHITELKESNYIYKKDCKHGVREQTTVKEVSAKELKKWLDNTEISQLIDVREPYEAELNNIGGDLIPLDSLDTQVKKISHSGKVVIYCETGKRSAEAIKELQENYSFDNLYNLKGGIVAWKKLHRNNT